MINLKNKFNQFKLHFEVYKESFENYKESQEKHLIDLKNFIGRNTSILTKDKESTEQYILQAEEEVRINQEKYSGYEAAITKIDNFLNDLESGDNLDYAVDFINKLQSIIDSLPQKPAVFPKDILLSEPFTQQAVLSFYNNKVIIDQAFCNLNAQYLQFSEVANETLTRMNEPQISICLNGNQKESMMIEQIATLSSKDGSPVDNNLLNAFGPSAIYGGGGIYLGIPHNY
ncbi:hypothetical protein [Providencia sp. JUb39]|uniref:hypothetical protein n=1 Tax=Providencia sp. JUb39 TaxID=2724165 RepID=UPI00164D4709|nr:hypothetical protein [Providencia sp. JUb39]MBC5792151.1 hypothetical protein [Providencia sp. JUb39]